MKVLLTDGSGLTSRQVATQLSAAGHVVEVVSPTRIWALRLHPSRAPRASGCRRSGATPRGGSTATLAVLAGGGFDVLLPTQEQVTILARDAARLPTPVALPSFESLLRVQDKVAQLRVLEELGLPHPASTVTRRGGRAGIASRSS